MTVIARQGGTANYSSGGTSKFIPQHWSPLLVVKSYASVIAGDLALSDYEGELQKMGDTVLIRKVPDITPANYTINGTITYVQPEVANTLLEVNKAIYAAPKFDNIDALQADVAMAEMFMDEMTKKFGIRKDTDFFADIYADVAAANQGATAGAISGNVNLGATGGAFVVVDQTNAVEFIDLMAQVLDEQNVDPDNRWIVLPAWFIRMLRGSELKAANITGDGTGVIRTAKVGRVANFDVYMSNLLHSETDTGTLVFYVLAGHRDGVAFVNQFVDTTVVDLIDTIGRGLRMVETYGYKVLDGTKIALGRVASA